MKAQCTIYYHSQMKIEEQSIVDLFFFFFLLELIRNELRSIHLYVHKLIFYKTIRNACDILNDQHIRLVLLPFCPTCCVYAFFLRFFFSFHQTSPPKYQVYADITLFFVHERSLSFCCKLEIANWVTLSY